jgi:hypothetical protein
MPTNPSAFFCAAVSAAPPAMRLPSLPLLLLLLLYMKLRDVLGDQVEALEVLVSNLVSMGDL